MEKVNSSDSDSKSSSTVQILRCPVASCSFITMLLNKLINHAKATHEDLKGINVLTCHLCKTISTDQSIMLEHYKMFHDLDDDVTISEKFYDFSVPSTSPAQSQDHSEEKLSDTNSGTNNSNNICGSRKRKAAHPERISITSSNEKQDEVKGENGTLESESNSSPMATVASPNSSTLSTTTGLESIEAATLLATQLLLKNQQQQIANTLIALQQTQQTLLSTANGSSRTSPTLTSTNGGQLNLTNLINSLVPQSNNNNTVIQTLVTANLASNGVAKKKPSDETVQPDESKVLGKNLLDSEQALDMSVKGSLPDSLDTTNKSILIAPPNQMVGIPSPQVLSIQQLQQLIQIHQQQQKAKSQDHSQASAQLATSTPLIATTSSPALNSASLIQNYIQSQNGIKTISPSGELISLGPIWSHPNISSVLTNGGLSANVIPFGLNNSSGNSTTGINVLTTQDPTRLGLQGKSQNSTPNTNFISLLDPRSTIQLHMNNNGSICLQPNSANNGGSIQKSTANGNKTPSVSNITNIIKSIASNSQNDTNQITSNGKSLSNPTNKPIKKNNSLSKISMNDPSGDPTKRDEENSSPCHVNHGGGSKPHRQNFTPAQNRILANWYSLHQSKPYPSTDDTKMLAQKTNLNYSQVKKWFANKRARTTNPSQLNKSPSGASMIDGSLFVGKDDLFSSNNSIALSDKEENGSTGENETKFSLRFDMTDGTPTMVNLKKSLTVIAPKPTLNNNNSANISPVNGIKASVNGNSPASSTPNAKWTKHESPADRAARIKQENECVIAIINEAKRESEEKKRCEENTEAAVSPVSAKLRKLNPKSENEVDDEVNESPPTLHVEIAPVNPDEE